MTIEFSRRIYQDLIIRKLELVGYECFINHTCVLSCDQFCAQICTCFHARLINEGHSVLHLGQKLKCWSHFGLLSPPHMAHRKLHGFVSTVSFFLPLFHKSRFVECTIVVLWTDSPSWAVDLCSSSKVTMRLTWAAYLINAFLAQPVSLHGWPCWAILFPFLDDGFNSDPGFHLGYQSKWGWIL